MYSHVLCRKKGRVIILMRKRYFDTASSFRLLKDRQDPIHAIGNGDIMAYCHGPEWIQMLGSPYSCPTMFSLFLPENEQVSGTACRIPRTNTWRHDLDRGTITETASHAHRCLARRWNLNAPFRMEIVPAVYPCCTLRIQDQLALITNADFAFLIQAPAYVPAYNDYPVGYEVWTLAAGTGAVINYGEDRAVLTMQGQGEMYVVSARTLAEAAAQLREAINTGFDAIITEENELDRAFLRRCEKNRAPLRGHPLRDEVLAATEDFLLLTRAQQSKEGGIQAGYNYHYAYVRDQYGMARGLLAAGAVEEAKELLRFDRDTFARHGLIANAQPMGAGGYLHIHENDEVEITGYLLLQATDMLQADGDPELFLSLKPMLNWALQSQIKWLHNDMLPFNGDETYVAGGLLTRLALNHGSFESTLLFISGGRRYIQACRELGCCETWMFEAEKKINAAADHFETNFRRGEEYVTNSLRRLDGLSEPEFRHGVCTSGQHFYFGWLHREGEGSYHCPECIRKPTPAPCREEFSLKSTLLMDSFIGAELIEPEAMSGPVKRFLEGYRLTGQLPSLPEGNKCLGYDYGLLLLAAAGCNLNADDLLADMLSIRDSCGAWAEYYNHLKPFNTLCRPWESAINIAAALRYLAEK